MSNIKLLQIGDRPFHVHKQTIFEDYSIKSDIKSQDFMYSYHKALPDLQWMNGATSFSIRGTHLSIGTSYNVDDVTKDLMKWIGKPTTIIAYEMRDLYNHQALGCACEASCDDGCKITFLQTYGVLKDVNVTSSDTAQPNEISLSFDIFNFWKELDYFSWIWGSNNQVPIFGGNTFPELDTFINEFPNCDILFNCNPCMGFQYANWENRLIYFDKDLWYEQYNNDCVPQNGGVSSVDISNLGVWFLINADKDRWNAIPESIYHATVLPNTGTLSIGTRRKVGFSTITKQSTINLDDLNTLLSDSGYGGLYETDVLISGDISFSENGNMYRPSFIIRNNSVLDVHPKWVYDSWFPGVIGTGYSQVSFNYNGVGYDGFGDISRIKISYVHHFRRM